MRTASHSAEVYSECFGYEPAHCRWRNWANGGRLGRKAEDRIECSCRRRARLSCKCLSEPGNPEIRLRPTAVSQRPLWLKHSLVETEAMSPCCQQLMEKILSGLMRTSRRTKAGFGQACKLPAIACSSHCYGHGLFFLGISARFLQNESKAWTGEIMCTLLNLGKSQSYRLLR